MFASAGLRLCKFTATHCDLLADIPVNDKDDSIDEEDQLTKTLGISLNVATDKYSFTLKLKTENSMTKAKVLSVIASIFDPIGWIGPVVLKLKLFLKKLWLSKLDWTDLLPEQLDLEWRELHESFLFLEDIKVDRHCLIINHISIELHGFCDASEVAYGAAVYTRSINSDGQIKTMLVCAKSKVAPKNQKTLARLELCSAVLLSKLIARIIKIFTKQIDSVTLWSDSTIVINWMAMIPSTLSTFVGNRVAVIQELTSLYVWKHIRTHENPADIISRGLSPEDLISCRMWWNGPSFFQLSSSQWPESIITLNDQDPDVVHEVKRTAMTIVQADTFLSIIESRFSRPLVLINMIGFIKRFVHNVRHKNDRRQGPLTLQEVDDAEVTIIKILQKNFFPQEIRILQQQNARRDDGDSTDKVKPVPQIPRNSSIIALAPFIDENGLLRVRGRIANCPVLTRDQKHPIIMPQCYFMTIIVRHLHQKHLHPGPKAMMSIVREKVKPRDNSQIMADLPPARVTMKPPFSSTAIDYAGAYNLKSGYTRNAPIKKCYVAVFKCMCTGAIHFELVSDLTAAAFLASLGNFVSRRGLCEEMYSDNATCFEGASNEIKKLMTDIDPIIKEHCKQNGINWTFTTPRAPHAGGIYESGVKRMKHHLKRSIDDVSALTYEQLYAILCKAEAIINSCPIAPMSDDINDLTALTPGHFLIGRPLISKPERNLREFPTNRLDHWQKIQQITQRLWNEWYHDYLHLLQQRPKGFRETVDFKVGDMVLVKDSNLPPMKWMLGRIETLFPGKDKVVRNVRIKTATGFKERHVRYLCKMPEEEHLSFARNVE